MNAGGRHDAEAPQCVFGDPMALLAKSAKQIVVLSAFRQELRGRFVGRSHIYIGR